MAHLLLLGIVKDFWLFWMRKQTPSDEEGPYRMPDHVRTKLKNRAKAVQMTKEHTKRAGDTKCDPDMTLHDTTCLSIPNTVRDLTATRTPHRHELHTSHSVLTCHQKAAPLPGMKHGTTAVYKHSAKQIATMQAHEEMEL